MVQVLGPDTGCPDLVDEVPDQHLLETSHKDLRTASTGVRITTKSIQLPHSALVPSLSDRPLILLGLLV